MRLICFGERPLKTLNDNRALIKSYGASKSGEKIQRSTVLIGKDGKVAAIWNPVRPFHQNNMEGAGAYFTCVKYLPIQFKVGISRNQAYVVLLRTLNHVRLCGTSTGTGQQYGLP